MQESLHAASGVSTGELELSGEALEDALSRRAAAAGLLRYTGRQATPDLIAGEGLRGSDAVYGYDEI